MITRKRLIAGLLTTGFVSLSSHSANAGIYDWVQWGFGLETVDLNIVKEIKTKYPTISSYNKAFNDNDSEIEELSSRLSAQQANDLMAYYIEQEELQKALEISAEEERLRKLEQEQLDEVLRISAEEEERLRKLEQEQLDEVLRISVEEERLRKLKEFESKKDSLSDLLIRRSSKNDLVKRGILSSLDQSYKRLHGIHSVGEMVDSSLPSFEGYIAPSPLKHKVQNESEFNFITRLVRELVDISPQITKDQVGVKKTLNGIYRNVTWFIERELVSGSFGSLYKITFESPGRPNLSIALKKINKVMPGSDEKKELDMLNAFNGHPRFVRYYGAGKDQDNKLIIAMELMESDIWEENVAYSDQMFVDLVDGLIAMYDAGIFHGDIKVENILTKEGRFFFTDLGGASEAHVGYSHPKVARTVETNAPEFSLYERNYNVRVRGNQLLNPFAADIYSTGMTLLRKKYPEIDNKAYNQTRLIPDELLSQDAYRKKLVEIFYNNKVNIYNPKALDRLLYDMLQPVNSRISLTSLKHRLDRILKFD